MNDDVPESERTVPAPPPAGVPPPPTAPLSTTPPPPIPPPPEPGPAGRSAGRVVAGAILVLVGLAWLLQATDVVDISVGTTLAILLIGVGIGLVALSPTGRHGGLIVLGGVLALLLAGATSIDLRLEGGVGERTERPRSAAELEGEYRLGVGELTVDLSAVDLHAAGVETIEVSVGIGELSVIVPQEASLRVEGHVGVGQLNLLGQEHDGVDVDGTAAQNEAGAGSLILEVSAGIGEVTVSSG